MNTNKKVTIIGLVVLIPCCVLAFYFNSNFKWKEIKARKWDRDEWVTICRANVHGKIYQDEFGKNTSFCSITDLDEMATTNIEGYVGKVEYGDSVSLEEGALFFLDNNYFVLYPIYDDAQNKNSYIVDNCEMFYGIDNYNISAPCPENVYVDKGVFESSRIDLNKNELDCLFDNITFEQAKKFYGRFTNEVADVDEINQTVLVDGYDNVDHKYYEKFILIDFKNRTISGYDKNKNWLTFDGTESPDESVDEK